MIKVLVLQVNHKNDNENLRDLENAIASGHTDEEGWQMPGTAQAGDLVVWYETDGGGFMARGFVEAKPWRLPKGAPYGPFRGHVAAVQRMPPVDGRDVKDRTGVDGGHEGYQTVKDEKAVNFLRSVGLLSSDEEPTTLAGKHRLTRAELVAEIRSHALDMYTDEQLSEAIGPHVATLKGAMAKLSVEVISRLPGGGL